MQVKQNRRGTVVRVGTKPTEWEVHFRHLDCELAKRFRPVGLDDPANP
jgi:hypothetical protein